MHAVVARALAIAGLLVVLAGCGTSPGDPRGSATGDLVLTIGAIPDQDPQVLQRMNGRLSDYLAQKLHVKVRYAPVTDYTAAVTTFARGDLQLVFFGALSGLQARAKVPGAVSIAQRDVDAAFHSVFIASARSGLKPVTDVRGLTELRGHSFTFGSETSTSGRLMPQYFLKQAGVELDDLKGKPGFSGSHDATAKLVAAGSYDAGALNASVWDKRVKEGKIDPTKVTEILRSPAFPDYNWLARPDLDKRFGDGFTDRLKQAVLDIDGTDATEREIVSLFSAKTRFVPTTPDEYQQVEKAATELGLLRVQ